MWADVVASVEELDREMDSTCQASSATSYEAIAEHPDHLLLSQLPDLAQLGPGKTLVDGIPKVVPLLIATKTSPEKGLFRFASSRGQRFYAHTTPKQT